MREFKAKAYSLDLRRRVFDALSRGESKSDIAKTFNVTTKTILKWQKRYEETGSMEKIIPLITRPRKVDYEKIKKFFERNPDKTLKEIGDRFKVSAFAAYKIACKLGITYKKTLFVRGAKGRFEKRLSGEVKPDSKE